MAYRITYEQNIKKTELPTTHRAIHIKKWIFVAFVCILLVSLISNRKVRSVLLPGDPQVTERALYELADDLREGESVKNAVTAFCREILDNA